MSDPSLGFIRKIYSFALHDKVIKQTLFTLNTTLLPRLQTSNDSLSFLVLWFELCFPKIYMLKF